VSCPGKIADHAGKSGKGLTAGELIRVEQSGKWRTVRKPLCIPGELATHFPRKTLLTCRGSLLGSALPLIGIEMKTHLPKVNLDLRKWHVIDANGAVLGRLAAQVANVLRGKDKPIYTPHMDAGDFVVVINAEKVLLTGKKEIDKKFMSYSGWKGGEHYRSVQQVRARHPEKLITHAVRGMVPKNRLGRVLMTKLKVYKGAAHPHAAQQPAPLAPAN
jgi:large subunit ribosomal protein L13